MIAPLSAAELALAQKCWRIGHTPDQQRALRLASRCLWYGALGCMPFLGLGPAAESKRVYAAAIDELGGKWIQPTIWPYWLIAFLYSPGYWSVYGLAGMALIYLLTVGFQTYWLARSLPAETALPWCAGSPHLKWGLMLGYLGVFTSIYLLEACFVCPLVPSL